MHFCKESFETNCLPWSLGCVSELEFTKKKNWGDVDNEDDEVTRMNFV